LIGTWYVRTYIYNYINIYIPGFDGYTTAEIMMGVRKMGCKIAISKRETDASDAKPCDL
jgi:hypothetical protein